MSTKPEWFGSPVWANWLAQDSDGSWHWYENEPRQHKNNWMNVAGMEIYAGYSQPPTGPKEGNPRLPVDEEGT